MSTESSPREGHEITIYWLIEGKWKVMAIGTGHAAEDATREDVVQGLTEFAQAQLRNSSTPREERPLLNQIVASATIPPFGEIAVDGFGREMKAEEG